MHQDKEQNPDCNSKNYCIGYENAWSARHLKRNTRSLEVRESLCAHLSPSGGEGTSPKAGCAAFHITDVTIPVYFICIDMDNKATSRNPDVAQL